MAALSVRSDTYRSLKLPGSGLMALSSVICWFPFVGNLSVELFLRIRRFLANFDLCSESVVLGSTTGTWEGNYFHYTGEWDPASSLRFMNWSQFAPFHFSRNVRVFTFGFIIHKSFFRFTTKFFLSERFFRHSFSSKFTSTDYWVPYFYLRLQLSYS